MTLDFVRLPIQRRGQALEEHIERDLLKTLPGVGRILSAVIALEIGDVEIGDVKCFAGTEPVVSYAGLVPTLHESAKKRRMGQCPSDANQYLRWALVEAANVVVMNQRAWSGRHVVQLYQRVRANTKRHGKAVVAVARHLGEAAYWILSKQEVYGSHRAKWPALSSKHG